MSIEILYDSDYRLRFYIFKCLQFKFSIFERVFISDIYKNFDLQIILCFRIESEVAKNNKKMQKILEQNEKTQKKFENIMKKIRASRKSLQVTTYSDISRQNFKCTYYFESYQNLEKLEKMKIKFNQKIADLELNIENTKIMRSLKYQMTIIYDRQKR